MVGHVVLDYDLFMPFLIGRMMLVIIAVSVTTYALQRHDDIDRTGEFHGISSGLQSKLTEHGLSSEAYEWEGN